MNLKKVVLLGAMAAGITACGSDDEGSVEYGAPYTGSTEAATLTEENKGAFADAAVALAQSGAWDEVVYGTLQTYRGLYSTIMSDLNDGEEGAEETPLAVALSFVGEDECGNGGSYTGSGNGTDEENFSAVVSFDEYCISYNLFANGSLSVATTAQESNRSSEAGFNNFTLTTVVDEEIVSFVKFNGQIAINENVMEESGVLTMDMNIDDNGELIQFSYKSSSIEEAETFSFKGDNGKTYKHVYSFDSFIFEPELGYVEVDNRAYDCSEARIALEEHTEGSSSEGYAGTVEMEDESGNLLEVNFGGTEESPCSFEPTSVVFTSASQLM